MAKKALIYGITGQDGSYLADLLLKRGYEIAGAANADASPNKKAKYFKVDLGGKEEEYIAPISEIAPDEVYYLAGISSHAAIAANPAFAFRVNAVAPIAIMESIEKNYPKARFFHASSAYIFEGREGRVDEKTYPKPIGPYGISKLCAHMMAIHFRKNGLFACNGILFNHESPVRPKEYVTRKITLAAAEIKNGLRKEPLVLGNLDAKRDWGFAGDYVEAMWLMLQQKQPDDYVIATGESHSVREFCEAAFSHLGMDYKKHIKTDSNLVRREEQNLSASTSKASIVLGWRPKVGFKELVHMMVDADMKLIRVGKEG
ncbi:TPA: GDP-mannose 4,6-dehydratase [Candidatus Micrarchaeota archaeon]|nr:GDP-mannose 4,6-dehydratase [Candidatus Micrarchaeota archaeon]